MSNPATFLNRMRVIIGVVLDVDLKADTKKTRV